MDNSKFLNRKIVWALTPEVKQALDELVQAGIDRDLALTMLENVLPDTEIFALPSDDDEVL